MSLATMPRRFTRALCAVFALFFLVGTAQAQWINEFHYDNDGGDEGEAVEVVLPSSADPADFDLYLYNGSNGMVYDGPINLATFTVGASDEGLSVYSIILPPNGIQNGSPDGLALTESGTLVPGQFLSYEGTLTATDGPASGETSTDVGVEEPNDTPIGQSLQLTGTGSQYSDFTWSGPADDSFGSVNDGQTFGAASATPVVTFTESATTTTEGDEVTLTVQLDFPNDTPDGNPVTVTVAFDEETSTADAADFDGPTPPQVTFDGTTDEETMSVTVTVIAGDGNEGDEAAVFDLIVAGGIADLGTPSTYTLTIEDSQAPDPARVQVIHNAADPAAQLVDISIVDTGQGGDGEAFNDVPFRSATPFFDLDPGTYQVTVTDEEDLAIVLIDETVTIASGETYQFIANGVAEPDDFEPNPDGQDIAATLFVNDAAQEATTLPGFLQVNAVQGVTDAPTVDVREVSTGTAIVDDAVYGDIGEYVSVPPGTYTLRITSADGGTVFATVVADLTDLGETAGTVLASGFLTPANDQDGPMAGLLAVLPDGTSFLLPYVVDIATARSFPNDTPVQVEGVVTRAMGDFTRMQDETGGLVIRQSSGAFNEDVADGTIAPGTELRVTGTTSEFNQLKQINDSDLQSYAVLGTTDVPAPQPVTLEEIAMNGEEYESELIRVFDLVIFPDGDTTFQPATNYDLLKFDVQFPVTLRVPNEGDTAIDGQPIPSEFATFTGVLGQFDSEDPAAGYQLLPVQADDVVEQGVVTVPVQFIHNAPDPALTTIDLYLDGDLAFDDFDFRTATPFTDVVADVAFEAAVAPGDSDSADDAFFTETYTLDSGAAYQLVATGVGEGDFEPNPDGEDITFTLLVNPDALLFSPTDDTLPDLNFANGTPDAPTLDVRTGETQDIILYNDVPYGSFAPYQPIAPDEQMIEVSTADGGETLGEFLVDLTDRIDEAGTILASGFLTPNNEPGDAPAFGLLVVFADGTSEFLDPLIGDSAEDGATVPAAFALDGNYPNPFARQTTLRYDLPADAQVSVEVYDVLGRRVFEVAPQPVAAGAGRTVALDAVLPSGAYLYRLTAEMPAETRTETGRMTVVR